MDFLRQFIMTGIRDMIDRGVALYQTYQYASGWFSKNVLLQEDLEEIDRLYKEKEEVVIVEPVIEDFAGNTTEETEQSAEVNNEEPAVVENATTENIVTEIEGE